MIKTKGPWIAQLSSGVPWIADLSPGTSEDDMYWPVSKEISFDLKILLFLVLVAMLFSQAEPSDQFW